MTACRCITINFFSVKMYFDILQLGGQEWIARRKSLVLFPQ